jgi:hypothetical protein
VRMSCAALILHVVSLAVPARLSTSPAVQIVRFFAVSAQRTGLCSLQPLMKAARWRDYQHSDIN